jgi:hypothetical protein
MVLTPCSIALLAACSAASWAAKGVLLRDPLNPTLPALAQVMTFPLTSVIVTIVLLKVDWIWATPFWIFRRSFFFAPELFTGDILPPLSLLPAHLAPRSFTGAGIGVSALAARRQRASMAKTPVSPQVHQSFDVHGNFPPQIPFDFQIALIDDLTDFRYFGVGQLVCLALQVNLGLFQKLASRRATDAVNVSQSNFNNFISGKINPCNARHTYLLFPCLLSLPLFVPGILANHPHDAFPFYHLTFVAYSPHGSLYFHLSFLPMALGDWFPRLAIRFF